MKSKKRPLTWKTRKDAASKPTNDNTRKVATKPAKIDKQTRPAKTFVFEYKG